MTPFPRLHLRHLFAVLGASLSLCAAARAARADDPVDMPAPQDDAARHRIDRTWLYADDARVAAPMTVIATTSLSYTNVSNDPSRILDPGDAPAGCKAPCNAYNSFAGNTAMPGAVLQVGGEVGLLPRLSVAASAQMGAPIGNGASELAPGSSLGAMAGLRVQVLPPEWQHLHLVLSGGYLREAWQGPAYDDATDTWHPGSPNGANGAWAQVSVAGDVGRLRLAGAVLGEHVFADYRDAVDVMVTAGASYRVAGPFRAGIEYVGQDIEETFSPEAEGGARHLVGPTASLQLVGERLSIVSGPALGLTSTSPTFVYRVGASYGF
jgi:hypothetical protein